MKHELEITYDFSGKMNTLFSFRIYGYDTCQIYFNNAPIDDEVQLTICVDSRADIEELQLELFKIIDKELESNTNYNKYLSQDELRKIFRWLREQLTIEVLTKYSSYNGNKRYKYPIVFEYNITTDSELVVLSHKKDFIIRKTIWNYVCPECNTKGELTTDKDEVVNNTHPSTICSKCGLNFRISND